MNYVQKIGNNTPIKEERMELKMKQKLTRKEFKKGNGITLIALVVTIVILLILAGITINYVFSEGGLFDTAKNSGNTWHDAENSDINALNELNGTIGSIVNSTGNGGITPDDPTPPEPEDTTPPEEATIGDFSKPNPEPNETITVTVTLGAEGSDINITSCKYIYDTTSSNLGTKNSVWESATAFTTNPEDIELTAAERGTYYLHILSVDNAGNKTESISSAITVAVSGPKLKLSNGNTEPLTEANYGQYLGRAVKYTPKTPGTSYGTSTTYRIFYIDFTGKYGEAGAVYLKADNDGRDVYLTSYSSYPSTDNYAVMKALNPSWTKPETMQISDYSVSWILDPNVWENWKDTTTAGIKDNINYVVGAPSLEMYVDSYNKYLDTHSGLVKNGTTNPAQKLACEYTTDTTYYAKGYRMGFADVASEAWANTGYYQNENSLISSLEANGMYNPESSKYYWLASPSANSNACVMFVTGDYSGVYNSSYSGTFALCPLVSLKSSVQLELAD